MKVQFDSAVLKFIIGWILVFLFRLIPFRPPNFEPMLATIMPFSKRYGYAGSFLFGFLGIILYDAITSGWGSWTAVTSIAYGLLGVWSCFYFRGREASRMNFLKFGIGGTLVYDAVTMMIGPVFNSQPISVAISGQIPFTMMHLLGTIVFATLLSPALYRWGVKNDIFEIAALSRAKSLK